MNKAEEYELLRKVSKLGDRVAILENEMKKNKRVTDKIIDLIQMIHNFKGEER